MPRQSRRISSTFGRTRMKYDPDNDFAKETRYEDTDNLGQPSGKYMRIPVLHRPKATKRASYCLQGEIELSQKWLLEEGCHAVDIDLGFSSSDCTSQANLPSLGSLLWAEDPIGAFPVPELNIDVKSCFNTPKHSESIHPLPFSCFTSEKFAFCQPLNHTNSSDSPVFSNIAPRSIKHVLPPDSGRQGVPLDLFDAGQHREIGFLDLSVREQINGDDKRKPKSPPVNCEELEFEMENCLGNDLLYSKEPIVMGGSNSNNEEDEFKEAKDGTLETKGSLGVETSSSVKILEKGESKGYECDEEIPLPCQSGTEQKKGGCLAPPGADPTLERFHQFPCPQNPGKDPKPIALLLDRFGLHEVLCRVPKHFSTSDISMFSDAASSNAVREALKDEHLQKLISDIDSSPDALNISDVIST
ncbi:hypothetical protein J1N35_012822 [Gossypium stocksii]|uniref:Uncharacterized protein n=1 Tax=Gossypium stocksii TaxID=47602 RepID=A0A9D3W525_9ROSI|nr:hypothetical protein J1N35_012822 [Gossypium stocksii]